MPGAPQSTCLITEQRARYEQPVSHEKARPFAAAQPAPRDPVSLSPPQADGAPLRRTEGVSSRWNSNVLLLSAFPESGGFIGREVDPADARCLAEADSPEPPPRLLIPRPPARKPRSEPCLPAPCAAAPQGPGEAGPTAPPRPSRPTSPASPGTPGEPSALRAATHPGSPLPHPAHGPREMRSGQAGERPGSGDEHRPPAWGGRPPGTSASSSVSQASEAWGSESALLVLLRKRRRRAKADG